MTCPVDFKNICCCLAHTVPSYFGPKFLFPIITDPLWGRGYDHLARGGGGVGPPSLGERCKVILLGRKEKRGRVTLFWGRDRVTLSGGGGGFRLLVD